MCQTHKEGMPSWKEYRLVVARGASVGAKLDRHGKKTIQQVCEVLLRVPTFLCTRKTLTGHQGTNLEDTL